MKKFTISSLLLSLLLMLGSCDSFLDVKPVGKVIPTTAEEFRALITEAYATVPDDRGLASFRSDEVLLDATMSSNDLGSYRDIWLWNDASPSENTASFSWRQFYHVLFIANYVIESEKMIEDGTPAEIQQMVGEAYMLRAYMHFILANLHAPAYGKCDPSATKAVPLKLDSDVEKTLGRSMLSEIYDQIVRDLDSAEEYLNKESWDFGYNYRFNTLSVDALRSRVLLYMERWDESLAASRRVLEKKSELTDVAATLPNAYNSVENIVALEQVMSAQYARTVKIDRDFYRLYSSSDLRRRNYFNQVTASNILLKKGGSNTYSCSLRTGEMYLNAAECAWHTGDIASARQYLLTLQKARFNDSAMLQRKRM